jgi:prepilin-type processing-associated H-X9-DG protein
VGLPNDRNRPKCDGVIYENARARIAEISDGTSNTLLVGERPPTPTLFWGWWTWSAFDASLGVRNTFYVYTPDDPANPGGDRCSTFYPESYRQGKVGYCDAHHFWSMHSGGAQWLFADGSVRFLPYQTNQILPALATRAGGEVVDWGS